jgi:hypothetical protein
MARPQHRSTARRRARGAKALDAAPGLHASATAAAMAAVADPRLPALLAKVDARRLGTRVKNLAAFGTRWTYSPKIHRVPEWVHDQFRAMGYAETDIRYQPFAVPGRGAQRNVLCGARPGASGVVLLCAHYDSISEKPAAVAPGADDNATGVAVLLEAAEVLRGVSLGRGLLFAAFGGEEQALYGSTKCAGIAAAEHWRIELVLNMDMIGYQDPARPRHIVVEYDQGNARTDNDAAARRFGQLMARAAAEYTALTTEHTDIWDSDYMPFEALGYPCIGVYEAARNPAYHRSTDTVGVLDMTFLAEVAKMVIATAYLAAR